MSDTEVKNFLNPITLEANFFLKTIEKYGSLYQVIDEELLNTMDKLVDALNKFYDQTLTKVEESENLKLIRVKNADSFVHKLYQCAKCHKFLGPSAEKAARHISTAHPVAVAPPVVPKRRKRTTSNANANVSVKLPKKARTLLTSKFGKLLRGSCHTAESLKQMPEYPLIEENLLNCLRSLYPDKTFKTFKFGSRISGIGNVDSDLDIFVDIDGSFHNFNERPPTEIVDVIKKLSGALKKDRNWSNVLAIQNARVPIIRLKHFATKIHCDIGFTNSLGYCNTMLMQYLFELQPLAARMCMFLKLWLERTGLNDNISTYSFTLMVIYYLQIYLVLPSIQELQDDLEKPEFIGPWISNFKQKTLKELNLEPAEVTKAAFREHMYNFFMFYGEFDYDNLLICPYKGIVLSIDDFIEELPERYANFIKNSETPVEQQLKKPMVVMDPIELSHNVTKGISKSLLKVITSYFMDSARIIKSNEEKPTSSNVSESTNTEQPDTD